MYIKGQIEANISNEANCIQQQENQGKLKTFKKFETNLNFEEYLNELVILNIVKLLQNSESLLIDCRLSLAAIIIFPLTKELVNFAT